MCRCVCVWGGVRVCVCVSRTKDGDILSVNGEPNDCVRNLN